MSTALQVAPPQADLRFSADETKILKETIMPGASDGELLLFGKVCQQTGMSPFARQIFPVSREVWNPEKKYKEKKWSFQTSVDGFRLVAQRSNEYEGQTAAQWCGGDGVWKDIWLVNDFPKAARVGVYRKGFREPLYAVAVWESYVQKYSKDGKECVGPMWQKMPELMIAKCAECLALRKAFPQELSGIYSVEEMAQAENPPSQLNPHAPSNMQPPEGDGVRDNGKYYVDFGTYAKRTVDQICRDIGKEGLVEEIEKREAELSGKKKSHLPQTQETRAKVQRFVDEASAYIVAMERGPGPEVEAIEEKGAFDRADSGTLFSRPKRTREDMGRAIYTEMKRLKMDNPAVSKVTQQNFKKGPSDLTQDEMESLLEELSRRPA